MSIFNQMIRGGGINECYQADTPKAMGNSLVRPRTFRETIQDQITSLQARIADLEAVRDSLTPEVESFVEAIQKLG